MLDHATLIPREATLPALLRHRAAERGSQIALREKIHGIWRGRTWADYYRDARRVALGLAKLGLQRATGSSSPVRTCRSGSTRIWARR
jgi:long-chain acyl-CoA synthetase